MIPNTLAISKLVVSTDVLITFVIEPKFALKDKPVISEVTSMTFVIEPKLELNS